MSISRFVPAVWAANLIVSLEKSHVFAQPGIVNRDYPVLLGAALVVTIAVLAANMIVDIVASLMDPRQVRRGGGAA